MRSVTFTFFFARVQICGVVNQWDSSGVPAPSTHGWHPRLRSPRKHNAQNRVMDLPGASWRCGSWLWGAAGGWHETGEGEGVAWEAKWGVRAWLLKSWRAPSWRASQVYFAFNSKWRLSPCLSGRFPRPTRRGVPGKLGIVCGWSECENVDNVKCRVTDVWVVAGVIATSYLGCGESIGHFCVISHLSLTWRTIFGPEMCRLVDTSEVLVLVCWTEAFIVWQCLW